LLADYLGSVEDSDQLAARLSQTPGVVEHGSLSATTHKRDPGRDRSEDPQTPACHVTLS
jgi:hypothetical protein